MVRDLHPMTSGRFGRKPGEQARTRKTTPPPKREQPESKPTPKHTLGRIDPVPRQTVRAMQSGLNVVERISAWLIPFTKNPDDMSTPEALTRPMLLKGMWLIVLLFGVVGMWAAFWPMSTGAVAVGRVMVDSNRKDIQHLEGGIVEKILVREGQRVQQGEVLVRLDNTNSSARVGLLRGQLIAAMATEARLIAERDKADAISFPEILLREEAEDPELAKTLDAQRRLFQSRREGLEGQISVLEQKALQSGDEIAGLREQVASASSQIALLNEEINVVRELVTKGNAVRPRLLALERQAASLLGTRGQAQSMISRAQQTINEAKISKINARNEFLNQVVAELKEVQTQRGGLEEQTRASDDVAKRIDIVAPIAGQITGLRVFTEGGVIKPGDTILSIVPLNDKLVVEARVSPFDIETVHDGLKAQVRMSGLSSRSTPLLTGTVVTVSADRFDEPQTGQAYFVARVEIPPEEMAALGDTPLSPGMPAEVLIITGRRTMLSYLFRPVHDSFGRAFRQE
jgi:HlyD family type I secretion membrane fusion protein